MRAALILLVSLLACPLTWGDVPQEAARYKRELTRIVGQEWGLGGPVALHAAQIHQESGWRAGVSSPAGAQGLAQFMPDTASWMAQAYPDLGQAAPYSPGWAMRAMARYNRWNWQRLANTADGCNRWSMALSAYNGGLGWVQRDQRLAKAAGADPRTWWGSVERYTNRADWARRENRQYVSRIMYTHTPLYIEAGWPGGSPCP
ncbi:transglycosylase SLT domain-containing protein [Pseudomonas sichuanensis]|uniref:transglycosylase SLT domain-containing protein n=1 Tax=Pseudomonas sichuanensis TaxID=2213015 RepID=UPI001FC9E85F|nr:transglycosylase SLT domain-containing protein [Pseudomonas sichuanensis]